MKLSVLAVRNIRDGVGQLVVEYRNADKFLRQDTGIRVVASRWEQKTQKIKKEGSPNPAKDLADASSKKDTLNKLIRGLHDTLNRQPSTDEVKEAIAAAAAPKVTDAENVLVLLNNYIEDKKNVLAPATIKSYKLLRNNIEGYQKHVKTVWNIRTLTNKNLVEWQEWMRDSMKYQNATLKKRVTLLKQILNTVSASDLNLEIKHFKALYKLRQMLPVVLSKTELELIAGLKLSGRLERVRDLFLIQCYCGLRFSDLRQINSQTIKGNDIVIRMEKTKDIVRIPIRSKLKDLFDKYTVEKELILPDLSNQKYNDYIKEVCVLVPELSVLETVEEQRGIKIVKAKMPKNELVSSHTARRTFITQCLEKGISERVVMQWSGHKDYKSFSKYINVNKLAETESAKLED